MPAQRPLPIWKGNTLDQDFRFRAGTMPFDLTGSTLVFRAVWMEGTVQTVVRKELTITDAVAGECTLSLSTADTRLFPTGRGTKYEIERRIAGKQTTLLFGECIVAEWANDDDA